MMCLLGRPRCDPRVGVARRHPTGIVAYSLRLDVTSSDYPSYDRNHNTAADPNADAELVTAKQTVRHGGEFASRILLPVMKAP